MTMEFTAFLISLVCMPMHTFETVHVYNYVLTANKCTTDMKSVED